MERCRTSFPSLHSWRACQIWRFVASSVGSGQATNQRMYGGREEYTRETALILIACLSELVKELGSYRHPNPHYAANMTGVYKALTLLLVSSLPILVPGDET